MTSQGPAAMTRRFVLLTALRWFPIGLTIPVTVLYSLDRGLTLAQVGIAFAIQGFVVLALELPSGSLADAWGRRPVLVLAGAVQCGALVVLTLADSLPIFIVVYALMGVFRALDSGALEAWFADGILAANATAPLERGLSAATAALGTAIGGGALLSSGLILAAPLLGADPLLLPIIVAVFFVAMQVVTTGVLVTESRGGHSSIAFWIALKRVPIGLAEGTRLLGSSRVLLAIVAVELFWGFGMVAFEYLTPVKLGEVLGSRADAAALMGPVVAAAWFVSALGAVIAERLARWFGVAALAALTRVLQGASVVALGLVAGPIGVITAFLLCYAVHGASNPLHNTLLHRQVTGTNRATILSMNSMVAQPAASIGSLVLGALAGGVSVSVAIVVGGVVLAVAAPLYLPARRAERRA